MSKCMQLSKENETVKAVLWKSLSDKQAEVVNGGLIYWCSQTGRHLFGGGPM